MRILLKLVIDCDADAAWRAVHSPRAVAELYGPLLAMEPLAAAPTSWEAGTDPPVQLSLAGPVPMGRQLISVSERKAADAHGRVRILRDRDIPLPGPLPSTDVWDHQLSVAPAPGDPTRPLRRDRAGNGGPPAPRGRRAPTCRVCSPTPGPDRWAASSSRSANARPPTPTAACGSSATAASR